MLPVTEGMRKRDRKWSYELLPITRRHCVADKQHNIPAWVATIMNPHPPISMMIAFVELCTSSFHFVLFVLPFLSFHLE